MANLVISVIIVCLGYSVNCQDLWLMAPWQYIASAIEITNLWSETRIQCIVEFKTKHPDFSPPWMVSCEVHELGINKYVVYSAGQEIMTVTSKTCKHSSRCLICTQWNKVPQIHGTNSLRPSYTGVNAASTLTLQINLRLKPISEWMSVLDSDIFWPGEVKNH